MNRRQLRRHDLHYLMSFIDFAFMVIIIFISLLSVAYFDPPGSAGVKRQKVLYTVKDAQELQKLGLTQAQVKELLVIRRQKHLQERKLQDLMKTKQEKPLSQPVPTAEVQKSPPDAGRWLLENMKLKKKLALLEKQMAQMKKKTDQREAQKIQRTAMAKQEKEPDKTSALHETALKPKPLFGGHEFLDLRK